MGCVQSIENSSRNTSSESPELHPWCVESGSGSDLWDSPPDEEEVRVFYEYAVDKNKRRVSGDAPVDRCASTAPDAVAHRLSTAVGKVKSMRPRMGQALSRRFHANGKSKSVLHRFGSRSSSLNSTGMLASDSDEGPKDYFLTVDHLATLAGDLGFHDLGRDELARIYANIPTDHDGKVGQEQFAAAVKEGGSGAFALRLLVRKLQKGFAYGFKTPDGYDFGLPSSQNYRVDDTVEGREFTAEFAHLRKSMDYTYHNNYTLERQRWQDEVIKSTVVRSSEQPAPWLVFTCGPMGVGKGFCMNWMSKHGFFPLENIVHVDPDAFKLMMPEWPKYVKLSGEDAGTLCHMESSFMMEIAQWAAMERRQNIWIDGSLRNADFYAQVFEDIRARYPHYKISIMYIYADEDIIRDRIKVRAQRTGRSVPESLIQASLGAMDKALNKLTPLCDFVARINNSGEVPVLSAFATVDATGSWGVLQERFARRYDDVSDFPQFLAPLPLVRLPQKDVDLLHYTAGAEELEMRAALDGDWRHAQALRALLTPSTLLSARVRRVMFDPTKQGTESASSSLGLVTSPKSRVTLSSHARRLAGIPEEAESYFWVFPLSRDRQESIEVSQEERFDPLVQLLFQGGFCYCSEDDRVVSVHALSHKREDMFMQFDSPQPLPRKIVEKMKKRGRFHPVVAPYLRQRGATRFCWVMPDEIFGRENVGGSHGAFAYLTDVKSDGLLFPVLSA